MAQTFDLQNFVNGCRKVKGAITIDNAMDLLEIGRTVYILLNTAKNVAVVQGEVLFVQHHLTNGEPDIKVTLEFRKAESDSTLKKHISPVILGEMVNGKSEFIGDEVNGNVCRMFVLEQDSLDYFEIVRYVRQLQAIEKASDIGSVISRLLKNNKLPPPE